MATIFDFIHTKLGTMTYAATDQRVDQICRVDHLRVEGHDAHLVMQVTDPNADIESLRVYIAEVIHKAYPDYQLKLVLTAERAPAPTPKGGMEPATHIPGVTHVIAVISGKGGVGKSTTAVNLAIALQQIGMRVGLLDADIYGPSIPRMMGLSAKPQANADKKLLPLTRFGVAMLSIGLIVPEDKAVIWRGPMVQSALSQLLFQAAWAPLDVLVIDMPPGTGDAHLTLLQKVILSGAVIVSTPQDIALIDARKAYDMYASLKTPILGIVENMSYFECPHCQHQTPIFHHGGAAAEAQKYNIPFLGEIPLELAVRESSDAGLPITATQPDHTIAQRYRSMAESIRTQLSDVPEKLVMRN